MQTSFLCITFNFHLNLRVLTKQILNSIDFKTTENRPSQPVTQKPKNFEIMNDQPSHKQISVHLKNKA